MPCRAWLSLLLLFAWVGPATAQPSSMREAAPALIAWKFKPKDRFTVETAVVLNQSRRALGFPEHRDVVHVNTVSSFLVKDVQEDGVVELEQKIDSTRVRFDGTNRLSAAGLAEMFGKMQGSTFKLVLEKDGKVRSLEGYQDMIKRLAQAQPADRVERFRQLVTEEDLKNATEEGFAFLPDYKVKVGDEWTRQTKLNMSQFGLASIDVGYKLESITPEGRAKIKVSCKQNDFKAGGPTAGMTRPDFTVEERNGTVVFDAKTGRLVSSDILLKIRGSLLVPNPANGVGTINLELAQQNNVRITLKDRPAK